MKSFEFDKKRIKGTKIPHDKIPLIIVHWHDEHYYGGSVSTLDLRKNLEEKLKEGFYEKEVVNAWVRNAEGWQILNPTLAAKRLGEYHQIKLVS